MVAICHPSQKVSPGSGNEAIKKGKNVVVLFSACLEKVSWDEHICIPSFIQCVLKVSACMCVCVRISLAYVCSCHLIGILMQLNIWLCGYCLRNERPSL